MAYRLWLMVLLMFGAISAMAQQSGSIVKEIVVRGNRRVSREAILAQMRTRVGQPYIQDNLDRDRQTLDDLGFFQVPPDIRATPLEGSDWRVTVDLLENPEVKEIRVVGNSALTREEILKAIETFFKAGDVFNKNSQRPASIAIRELYSKKGFDVNVEDLSPLAESPNTLNVALIETKIGQIRVQGNRTTKDWVIRRLIRSKSGEPFNLARWQADMRRVFNTQFFEDVEPLVDAQRELGVVDLTVNLKEQRTGQFNVGLQLDPRNSLAGVITLSENNFRGTGQAIGLNFIQAAQGVGPSLDLDYTNPFIDNRNTTIRVSAYSRVVFRFANAFQNTTPTDGNDQYFERRTGGSLGFSRLYGDYMSLGVSARVENVRTDNVDLAPATGFIQQDGDVAVLTLGGIMNRRDRDVDATSGDWFSLNLEPGYSRITKAGGAAANSDILGSNTFFRASGEYRRYLSKGGPIKVGDLGAPRQVLALRARYGTIGGQVPFFEQFFAGGANSVRGYPEDRFWGRNQVLTTAEYRYPLQKTFSIVGFVDYGGAWGGYGTVNNFDQSDRLKLHLGYGLGISFRTPFGPIRLDLGINENGNSRVHFLIGTSF